MTALLLDAALVLAQVMLAVAMGCAALRLLVGPRAQDRVLALDTLYVNAAMLLLVFGIRPVPRITSKPRCSSRCSASSPPLRCRNS